VTSADLARWGGTSTMTDLDGPTHVARFGGPADAPRALLVHGAGGSLLDFLPLAPELRQRLDLYAVDLPGSGRSPRAGRSPSIAGGAELLDRIVRDVVGEPALLVGNSLGGIMALEYAVRHPAQVTGVVLLNCTQPLGRGGDPRIAAALFGTLLPWLPQRLLAAQRAKEEPEAHVLDGLRIAFADPDAVPRDLVREMAAQRGAQDAEQAWEQDAAFVAVARSIVGLLTRPRRHRRLFAAVEAPVLMIHGEDDAIIPVRWARTSAAALPRWAFHALPGVGHMPQAERPDLVAKLVLEWLDTQ
jgi:pimeloyl-ACP methyl ester carboxylesterase